MGKIKNVLFAEEARLKAILKTTKERLKNAPEGSLRLSSNKFGRMYYHQKEKKEYISKNNTDLIRVLAQKSYDKKQARKKRPVSRACFSFLLLWRAHRIP